ncbi:hypothetical protein GC102_21510 [Paenibacillus sp. LMG 31460]|uniref:SGNH hydrolase-type esterase domain-containing protein n=1 Tax=Paenibacillus germinis TaxID=2654979 RepID=A0ABX1Z4K6_9BACL|nr:SGNH/GDSL hydrolase family protein [Paenibacillus germinis]NOU88318.1 hypothetical protein [Paenibacillus germinis]
MKERIVLPERIYLMAGEGEQFHIYYRNAIIGLAPDEIVNVICQYGKQYREFWRMEPGKADVPHFDITQGEFPLRLQILNRKLEVVSEQTTQIVIVPKEVKTEIPMLCIGDSITRCGGYVAQVQESLAWVRSIGTRTYENGKVNREGRGGWTAENYVKRIVESDGGDSPFLFPVGEECGHTVYWGNTVFWKRVISEDPSGYFYDGFLRAARNQTDAANPFRIGSDGYPFSPQIGDTVCDPSRGHDFSVCRWDGSEWKTLHPQPHWELDFARYLAHYQVEMPHIVTFLFGANEFQTVERIDDGVDTYLGSMQQMIDEIHACNPSIRIVINLPVAGADQDAWGLQLGCTGSEARYRRNIQEASLAILRRWDHAQARERGIYICPILLAVDPYYGFDRSAEPVNKYVPQRVERHNNWVHPGVVGHQQMGDMLAATVQGLLSDL